MWIISHRGIDNEDFVPGFENSRSAIRHFMERDIGLEVDLAFTGDGEIILCHDHCFKRFAQYSKDSESALLQAHIGTLKASELRELFEDEVIDLNYFLSAIYETPTFSAIHFKGNWQSGPNIDKFVKALTTWIREDFETRRAVLDKFLVFDLKVEFAQMLSEKMAEHDLHLHMAFSISHEYDIMRYNSYVGNTLYSIQDAVNHKGLCDWVWLDEWDLVGDNDSKKKFYNQVVFGVLRKHGYKIAVISPELHGTSPAQLGGERHEDSEKQRLMKRWEEIISLQPDLICTDHCSELIELSRNKKEMGKS